MHNLIILLIWNQFRDRFYFKSFMASKDNRRIPITRTGKKQIYNITLFFRRTLFCPFLFPFSIGLTCNCSGSMINCPSHILEVKTTSSGLGDRRSVTGRAKDASPHRWVISVAEGCSPSSGSLAHLTWYDLYVVLC